MKPAANVVIGDAYLAWVQGDDDTRAFRTFEEWLTYRLGVYGYVVVAS